MPVEGCRICKEYRYFCTIHHPEGDNLVNRFERLLRQCGKRRADDEEALTSKRRKHNSSGEQIVLLPCWPFMTELFAAKYMLVFRPNHTIEETTKFNALCGFVHELGSEHMCRLQRIRDGCDAILRKSNRVDVRRSRITALIYDMDSIEVMIDYIVDMMLCVNEFERPGMTTRHVFTPGNELLRLSKLLWNLLRQRQSAIQLAHANSSFLGLLDYVSCACEVAVTSVLTVCMAYETLCPDVRRPTD